MKQTYTYTDNSGKRITKKTPIANIKNIVFMKHKHNHCTHCGKCIPLNSGICKECLKKHLKEFDKELLNKKNKSKTSSFRFINEGIIDKKTSIEKIKGLESIKIRTFKKNKTETHPTLNALKNSSELIASECKPYKFSPDKELLDFAKDFSEKYKFLKVGIYKSRKNKYQIHCLSKIKNDLHGHTVSTPIRIANTTRIIEISKNKFRNKNYTSDFVFFIILWCIAMVNVKDYYMADKSTLTYYLEKTKRSKRNIIKGYLQMFKIVFSELNIKRLGYICYHCSHA